MRNFVRKSIQILILSTVAFFFVNCSEQSTDSGLYGSACNQDGTCSTELESDGSQYFIAPRAEASIMECTHDHVQVGGSCETNGALDSYIEYSMTYEDPGTPNAAVDAQRRCVNGRCDGFWAGNVTLLREARCENGRYYLIIPRPTQGINSGAASSCFYPGCTMEMHINARMFVMKKGGTQFELGATAPVLPISIQQITGGGTVCPN